MVKREVIIQTVAISKPYCNCPGEIALVTHLSLHVDINIQHGTPIITQIDLRFALFKLNDIQNLVSFRHFSS